MLVGCTASEAGRIGAVAGIGGRVVFADFSSRSPEKSFAKIVTPPQSHVGNFIKCHNSSFPFSGTTSGITNILNLKEFHCTSLNTKASNTMKLKGKLCFYKSR